MGIYINSGDSALKSPDGRELSKILKEHSIDVCTDKKGMLKDNTDHVVLCVYNKKDCQQKTKMIDRVSGDSMLADYHKMLQIFICNEEDAEQLDKELEENDINYSLTVPDVKGLVDFLLDETNKGYFTAFEDTIKNHVHDLDGKIKTRKSLSKETIKRIKKAYDISQASLVLSCGVILPGDFLFSGSLPVF